ncbi:hypothetical protein [Mycobacteroides sp. LB1]|uniref:hypothetical protein n=1 Tax=Mycobacteroides sp. LB1 TaxID=2750814 RepID=UPI001C5F65EF
MLLCFILAVVLFPFFWSAGLYLGFWITFGISVILAIAAVARMIRFKEKLCYRHAVLAGLCFLTWFVAVEVAVEYGLQTLHR